MAITLFFTIFSIYLISLAPGLTFGDSGELAAAAYTMGTAHPPGYIGWVLPGRLFSLLPLGSVCFRLSIMSAFFASLGSVFVYKSLCLMRAPIFWAALSTILFAFTAPFYDAAIITEVYALNIFWFSLFIYIYLFSIKNGPVDIRHISLLALVSGLAATGHHTSLALVPVWLLMLFQKIRVKKGVINSIRASILTIVMFITGLMLYGLMPIASSNHPMMDWGAPNTFSSWLHTVTRAQYKGFDKFERSFETLTNCLSNFMNQAFTWQLTGFILMLTLGLVICGYLSLKDRNKKSAVDFNDESLFYTRASYIIIWFLLVFSLFLLWLLMPLTPLTMNKTMQFYIPFYMSLLLLPWLIAGLVFRYNPDNFRFFDSKSQNSKVSKDAKGTKVSKKEKGVKGVKLVVFIAGFVCSTLVIHKSLDTVLNNSRSDNSHASRFVTDLATSVFTVTLENESPGTILFLDHDDNFFPLIYERICNRKHLNIIPICPQFLSLKWYFNELKLRFPKMQMTDFDEELNNPMDIMIRRLNDIISCNKDFDIFFQVNDQPLAPSGYKLVPQGLVFKLVPKNQGLSNINKILNFRFDQLLNYQDMIDGSSLSLARLHDPDTAAALRYYGLSSVNLALFALNEQESYRAWEFLKTADPFIDFMKTKEQIKIEYLKGKALVLSGFLKRGKTRLKQARKMGYMLPEKLDKLLNKSDDIE